MTYLWENITQEHLVRYDDCIDIIREDISKRQNKRTSEYYALKRQWLANNDYKCKEYHRLLNSGFTIIYFDICEKRRKNVKEICDRYHLEYMEDDYRKSYVRFKIKENNMDMYYTYLKLTFS